MENQNHKYCPTCDKWLDDPSDYTEGAFRGKESGNLRAKCNTCNGIVYEKGSISQGCGFCFKTIDGQGFENWKRKGSNFYKRVAKGHDYDEKTETWTINHECKVKCQTCEETKPIEEMLIGILFSFGDIPYCDSCCWKDMKEEEKQTYERYANSHVAEEKRIYQRYLKLKSKFSDRNPRERERERERERQNAATTHRNSAIREHSQ